MLCAEVHSRQVWIALYSSVQVRSMVVSAYGSPLIVYEGERAQFVIAGGEAVYMTLRDGKIWVSSTDGPMGAFSHLMIQGADSSAVVRLRPVAPKDEARNYEDMIRLSADIDRIRMVNCIDEERYIAGVVEAEAGQGKTPEFYKAKAIICRTYLYGHISRHATEGVHLCDGTHCQAYKGQCRSKRSIKAPVADTRGIVLADPKNSKPILAAYHSNCGGETESARNVWQHELPHLVPVTDPHCGSQPNARWTKIISLDEWLAYLVKNGFKPRPEVVTDFSFQQVHRVPDYTVNDFTLPVRKIRNDWQLRSTFFSVAVEDGDVVISGRGYGHGVGLCQEGAMVMGSNGRKYDEIISFYYRYVNMVPVSSLHITVPEFDGEWEMGN